MEKHGDEILAGAVLGIGCFLLASWHSTSIAFGDNGQVLILNAATEPVKWPMEVCGQKFPFGEIEQGKIKAIQYKVWSDSQYKLEVEFHSGKKLEKELGSVTNGQDVEDVFTVNNRNMSLTR